MQQNVKKKQNTHKTTAKKYKNTQQKNKTKHQQQKNTPNKKTNKKPNTTKKNTKHNNTTQKQPNTTPQTTQQKPTTTNKNSSTTKQTLPSDNPAAVIKETAIRPPQADVFAPADSQLHDAVEALNPDNMTPKEELAALYELKRQVDNE